MMMMMMRATDQLQKSKMIVRATKVKTINSNVKGVLLNASESWTVTKESETEQKYSPTKVYEEL